MNPKSLFASIALGLLVIGSSSGQRLTLDHISDTTDFWVDSSCHYNDNPEDFWVYGCNATTLDSSNSSSSGFWTNCRAVSCDIIFNAGFLPKVKRVSVRAYLESDSSVSVTTKLSPTDLSFYSPLGTVSNTNLNKTGQWREVEFGRAQGFSILKLTLTGSEGLILLDSVTVDFAEVYPEPIMLDVQNDEIQSHWRRDSCQYLEDYKDFQFLGCPTEPSGNGGEGAVGFWSPCAATSCQMQFYTDPNVIPRRITVRGYVNGSAEIKVLTKMTPKSGESETGLVKTISIGDDGDNDGWLDVAVELDTSNYHAVVAVELTGAPNSLILLDSLKVDVAFWGSIPTSTTPAPGSGAATGQAGIVFLLSTLLTFFSLINSSWANN